MCRISLTILLSVLKIGPISTRTVSIRHQSSRKFFNAYMLPIRDLWTARFCVCPFLRLKIKKEFRIATVAVFRCDLYAAVFPQMSPPPPTNNCARLRTTSHDNAQLSTMVDFIVLSIKFVFMVVGVSYSRVLAQRPTRCCSAGYYTTHAQLDGRVDFMSCDFK